MAVRVELLPPEVAPAAGRIGASLRSGRPLPHLPALPVDDADWMKAIEDAARRVARPVPELVERLVARQRVLGTGARAADNTRALADAGTVAVVTGQQPGLLGGPLLSFHKAAGAIHLARRLDALVDARVVPVFWLASEDHDLDEVNRVRVVDRSGQLRRVSLDARADGRSVMHVPVSADGAGDLLAEIRDLLPATDRAREVTEALTPAADTDIGTWGGTCLSALLGDAGLVVVEPEVTQPFAGQALAALARQAPEIRASMTAAAASLEAAGLPAAPLDIGADYVPLFVRETASGPRLRVTDDGEGRAHVRGRGPFGTLDDLAAHLRREPRLGSGDAAGRVFVQNRLLPVLAYVGGPTELAYWVQVCAAHEATGLTCPLAVPRPEATWVDARDQRTAAAFEPGGLVEVLAAGAREAPPSGPAEPQLEEAYDRWVHALRQLPPEGEAPLAGEGEGPAAVRRLLKRIEDLAHRQRSAVLAAYARDRGTGAARWVRLQTRLFPRGRPQERELSALSVVARYGLDAFREGLAALDPLADGRYLVHVS